MCKHSDLEVPLKPQTGFPNALRSAANSSKQLLPGLHQPFRCTRPSGVPALPVHPFSGTIVTTRWNLDTNSFWEMPLCLYWGLRWCSGLCGTEKEAQSHSPQSPRLPGSTHCSNSQHRWTNGKERDQLGYFPPVKSQKHDNKVLQIWLGGDQEQITNSILLKCVLFLSYVAASTLPSLYRYFDFKVSGCNQICIRTICFGQP